MTNLVQIKLTTLREQTEYELEKNPATRDNDKLLVWQVWSDFYGLFGTINKEKYLSLPSSDEITRIRRVIQNDEKKYLPTTFEVAKARGWQEVQWRYYLGYSLNLLGEPECPECGTSGYNADEPCNACGDDVRNLKR